ncbi:hypothetical protein SR870_06235 [Rhodopseudomonas palustris]|uniref:hypothetical protein n=1 Tax=Rhodopseudomonas palustris TaxID=1076 RepID=UPI002ACEC82A|nr:hypothetical protein [Rhodopseudomonas palustris]WQH00876.1 hypothetical protein SR870_06235 [Rhodopseudomonas palustris]
MDIYMTTSERTALSAVDSRKLDELIDKAVDEERSGCLGTLNLRLCGPFVSGRLDTLERTLSRYREAKSSRKREEVAYDLERAKRDLSSAVRTMQERADEEMRDQQHFHVEGEIAPPYRFSHKLTARVSYRWRKTVDDDWTHGNITFVHNVDTLAHLRFPPSKRKLSARKQQQELQKQLSDTWEHMMRSALYSVRDYLKEGRDPVAIPETFVAKADASGH